MIAFIILILLCIWVLIRIDQRKNTSTYDYKCFLLTMKNQKERQERFFKSHKEQIPLEVIIGPDTRIVKVAREYEDQIEEEHFEKL